MQSDFPTVASQAGYAGLCYEVANRDSMATLTVRLIKEPPVCGHSVPTFLERSWLADPFFRREVTT
jgi:hypothetical protein